MRRRLRTETTIETHQVTVIRKRRGATTAETLAWCDACRAEVSICTPEEAAIVVSVSVRAIYSRVEAAQLHFTETSDGGLLICMGSLTSLEQGGAPKVLAPHEG